MEKKISCLSAFVVICECTRLLGGLWMWWYYNKNLQFLNNLTLFRIIVFLCALPKKLMCWHHRQTDVFRLVGMTQLIWRMIIYIMTRNWSLLSFELRLSHKICLMHNIINSINNLSFELRLFQKICLISSTLPIICIWATITINSFMWHLISIFTMLSKFQVALCLRKTQFYVEQRRVVRKISTRIKWKLTTNKFNFYVWLMKRII